ncbi:MAG TPA: coniferyl aldehyde dehydrogenase [Spongiibacteraceae bacterium]|nr:coniferyl aldehyde dehydrogenase [Spongiibacteraceae bacterium]
MNSQTSPSGQQRHSAEQIAALVERQRAAFNAAGQVSYAQRMDRLERCIKLLIEYKDQFCESIDQDFNGRHRTVSLMGDIIGPITSLKTVKKHLKKWMKPSRRSAMFPFQLFGSKAWVEYQPKGVIGIIGTWNAPLFTVLSPLAYVLAAGNRALIKPSELTPRTSQLLQEAIEKYFDSSEVAVVNGGAEVAAAFSAQPFDHLVLTGGTHVGRAVMQAAAQNLVPLTLELGGKSPAIVGRSADLKMAAHRIAAGKLINNGQICVSPDYVYVPKENIEQFIEHCRAHYQTLVPEPAAADLTAIINQRHAQRVESYVADARQRGLRVENCGARENTNAQYKPTLNLVIDPPADSAIMQHEIFGPAMVILAYDDIDRVIDEINRRPRPLALYYFGRDAGEERKVLSNTISGGVTINEVALHPGLESAPFGGIGPSGMGSYHGREGFGEFSHAKTIFKMGWGDPRQLFGMSMPYSDKLLAMLERSLR